MVLEIPRGALVVDERKVRDYLLSRSHLVGRFKARVFAAIGFDDRTVERFIVEVRRIATSGEVTEVVETAFGRKYVVPGDLIGPYGLVPVLTIWFEERGQEEARLVTVRSR